MAFLRTKVFTKNELILFGRVRIHQIVAGFHKNNQLEIKLVCTNR